MPSLTILPAVLTIAGHDHPCQLWTTAGGELVKVETCGIDVTEDVLCDYDAWLSATDAALQYAQQELA